MIAQANVVSRRMSQRLSVCRHALAVLACLAKHDTPIFLRLFFGGQIGKHSEGGFADFTIIFACIVLRILASQKCLREINMTGESQWRVKIPAL
jgi:hypothetical protein